MSIVDQPSTLARSTVVWRPTNKMPLSPVFATGVDASAVIISAAAGASVVAWVLADVDGRAEADARVDADAIVDGDADTNALVDALGDGDVLADGAADVDTLAITLGAADGDALGLCRSAGGMVCSEASSC